MEPLRVLLLLQHTARNFLSFFFFLSNFPKPSLVFSNSVTFPWTDIGLRSPEVKRIYVNTFLLAAFWPTGSSPVFSWRVWRALKSSAWPLPTSEAATQTLCHSSPTLPLTDIWKHFFFFFEMRPSTAQLLNEQRLPCCLSMPVIKGREREIHLLRLMEQFGFFLQMVFFLSSGNAASHR